MKKGLITKVLHKGQKVYGVITEFDEANVTVGVEPENEAAS
jgi:hypothetical protein